jgi:hypothetical protein
MCRPTSEKVTIDPTLAKFASHRGLSFLLHRHALSRRKSGLPRLAHLKTQPEQPRGAWERENAAHAPSRLPRRGAVCASNRKETRYSRFLPPIAA